MDDDATGRGAGRGGGGQREGDGHGVAHAAGELVSCPFCLSVWIASALGAGLVFAPRATRLVAGVFTAVAGSNVLQLGYDAAKKASGNAGHAGSDAG